MATLPTSCSSTGEAHDLAVALGQAELAREDLAVGTHALEVVAGLLVAELHQACEAQNRLGLRDPHLVLRQAQLLQRVLEPVARVLDGVLEASHQLLTVALAASAVQGVGDVDEQLSRSDGLDHVAIRAVFDRVHRELRVVLAGDHHDGGGGEGGADVAEQLHARLAGHAHVEQHQRVGLARKALARVGGVARPVAGVAAVGHDALRPGPQRRVVVHDQQFRHRMPSHAPSPPA